MKHFVIIVPGLGDGTKLLTFLTRNWTKYGLAPVVYPVEWGDGEKMFTPKLKRLVDMVDKLSKTGKVSLVGTSAGGSAVINAFAQRKNKIHRIINVCGRLRRGTNKRFRSFKSRVASSASFADSVLKCERNLVKFTPSDLKKIMTVRAVFDELVPGKTAVVSDAKNIVVPLMEHGVSIALAMSLFSKPIINFINEQD